MNNKELGLPSHAMTEFPEHIALPMTMSRRERPKVVHFSKSAKYYSKSTFNII